MIRAALTLAVAFVAGCDLVFAPASIGPRDGAVDQPDAPPCPSGYDAVPGAPSQYKIVMDPMLPWPEAENACETDSAGVQTHLVVFDDFPELAAVREAMPSGGWLAHAGFARRASDFEDAFTAVTGAPLSPSSPLWEPGEPTGGTERVTYFQSNEDLIDGPHDIALSYVCECDGRPATLALTFP